MKRHIFTEEEKKWVQNNFDKYTFEELTKKFNIEFGCEIKSHSLSDLCSKRMKLKKTFNRGHYKKGGNTNKNLPVGTERKTKNATYVKVHERNEKSRNYKKSTGYRDGWIPKQQKIYEEAHGKIPDGHMVCFLDGDRDNYNLENLCCINRKISAILSRNRWWSNNQNITLTAIKYAELIEKLKERK